MLSIRLQRIGKKKLPTYRIIINEKGRDTHDVYLELLGTYNPHAKENQFQPNAERIQYWMSKGAEVSDTIHNLLVKAGVIKAEVKKAVFLSKKRSAKLGEKKKADAEAQKAREEKAAAAKAAAEEAAAAEKAAAEEAKKVEAEAAKAAKEADLAAEAAAKEAAPAATEAASDASAEAASAAQEEAPAETPAEPQA